MGSVDHHDRIKRESAKPHRYGKQHQITTGRFTLKFESTSHAGLYYHELPLAATTVVCLFPSLPHLANSPIFFALKEMNIPEHRKAIDNLDEQIVRLLNER